MAGYTRQSAADDTPGAIRAAPQTMNSTRYVMLSALLVISMMVLLLRPGNWSYRRCWFSTKEQGSY